jgi:hypothetical protein
VDTSGGTGQAAASLHRGIGVPRVARLPWREARSPVCSLISEQLRSVHVLRDRTPAAPRAQAVLIATPDGDITGQPLRPSSGRTPLAATDDLRNSPYLESVDMVRGSVSPARAEAVRACVTQGACSASVRASPHATRSAQRRISSLPLRAVRRRLRAGSACTGCQARRERDQGKGEDAGLGGEDGQVERRRG